MKEYGLLHTLKRCFYYTKKYAGKYFVGYTLTEFLFAVISALLTIMNTALFNAVELVTQGASWTTAIPILVLLGFAVATVALLAFVSRYYGNIMDIKTQGGLQIPLNETCAKIEATFFESPTMLNRIGKAVSGSTECVTFTKSILCILVSSLPYVTILGVYFYTLRPMLVWSVILIFIPVILTQLLRIAMFRKFEDEVAPIRRENDYFDRCISHRDYFKETRLLGAYMYFAKRFRDSLRAYCRASSRVEIRSGVYGLISHVLTLLGYIGVLFLLFDSVMGGFITIGSFAAVFASLASFIAYVEEFFENGIGNAAKSYGAVCNYISFVDSQTEDKCYVDIESRGDVILKNVHFTYPGSDSETIKGVTFSIKPGETLAVVGENGAGKSTLMRLITGQYLATAGKVVVSGHDLAELSPAARYNNVSAVFQRFGRYRMTVEGNITLSSPDVNKTAMFNAAHNGDVCLDDTRSFPDGSETMLSSEFGGVDISGGQWQRIAVARGLYRTHNLVILDEPTAAIDPIEETKLYSRFSDISREKTAIIVTHRLGSARIADRIIVMKNGLIDDIGSHDELISKGGYYAQLYEAQSDWYIK